MRDVQQVTSDEITIAKAIGAVTFVPGIPAKRLARQLCHQAEANPSYELTQKQREAMLSICVRFRRQVPAGVVELARRLRGEV